MIGAMQERESTRDDKAASRLVSQGDDGRFDLCVVMRLPPTDMGGYD
jgi:hypothetical protein